VNIWTESNIRLIGAGRDHCNATSAPQQGLAAPVAASLSGVHPCADGLPGVTHRWAAPGVRGGTLEPRPRGCGAGVDMSDTPARDVMWKAIFDSLDDGALVPESILDNMPLVLAAGVEGGKLEECSARGRQVDGGIVWDAAWRLPEEAPT
jgi:hypothetical protein